ncbi:MAG: DegT/DnrJ/EryC1/StrS aminotransferase family protein [Flavobacteriales bacterium TMED235]|nr:MAG: DegT/DnrJ/EryC1/StrS aminotransferase family protein [Flavobacteriales bacterium TMED235]
MKNNFFHPLMQNNITISDRKVAANFIRNSEIFTASSKVREFENRWSKWLGVKYSIFVNSGSSANFLTFLAIKLIYGTGDVIVPPLTWNSDIIALIKNDFKPKFVDINLRTLSMDNKSIIDKLNSKTKAVFLTHAQGFNGLTKELILELKRKKILLIEDVCESHGATFQNKKLGTFGKISNFSFYYAHHLSTIEGGMICTNDKKIYETIKILRGHGLLRESGNKIFESKIKKKYKKLSPNFIFLYPGFNMRNNEIQAVIGLNQLKRLNKNNKIRTSNFNYFIKNLDRKKYYCNFLIEGNSNYAFPIILNKANLTKRNNFEKYLYKNKIEFRRGNAGGGNQLRQPYLKKYIKNINLNNFSNVELVHNYGYYIGNFPTLDKNKIKKILKILNAF